MMTTHQPLNKMKAALFVDFDNIYLGLKKMDPRAAEEFATNPARWVTWFEQGMPDNEAKDAVSLQRRALLIRRCYLNPGSFSNYRAYFTRSAFSVVDCPSLTGQNKNSADIHMVMDILDTLKHATHFDEFIILSGDADFTPVLLRLRTHDRRTVILTTGPAAQPYKAASDHVVTGDVFIDDALGSAADAQDATPPRPPVSVISARDNQVLNTMAERVYEEAVASGGELLAMRLPPIFKEFSKFRSSNNWLGFHSLRDLTSELTRLKPEMHITEGELSWGVGIKRAAVKAQEGANGLTAAERVAAMTDAAAGDGLRERIIKRVKLLVAASSEPVNMASAAGDVIRNVGQEVVNTQWAGAGSFKELLLSVDALGFEIVTAPGQPGLICDPRRHAVASLNLIPDKFKALSPGLAAFASRINRVTGTPLLSPSEYALVFNVLEEELRQNPYFLTATSRAVRDRCIELGSSVARRAVNFILQGIIYGGHVFEVNPLTDTAANFAETFKENVLNLCKNAQLELTDEELKLLDDWIRPETPGQPPDAG